MVHLHEPWKRLDAQREPAALGRVDRCKLIAPQFLTCAQMSDRAKQELIAAWSELDRRKTVDKRDLREILSLTRVLLEREGLSKTYPVLCLYCDWSVHWEIDRNVTGHAVLIAISENIVRGIFGTSLPTPNPLTGNVDPHSVAVSALSSIASKQLRREWLGFYAKLSIPTNALKDYNGYHHLFGVLLESLCQRPISLGPFGSDGLPTKPKNRRHYDAMLRNASADPELAPRLIPLSLRIDHGANYVQEVNLENLPNDDAGHTIRAIANGYVWVVHFLPDTSQIILIMDDEKPADFTSAC